MIPSPLRVSFLVLNFVFKSLRWNPPWTAVAAAAAEEKWVMGCWWRWRRWRFVKSILVLKDMGLMLRLLIFLIILWLKALLIMVLPTIFLRRMWGRRRRITPTTIFLAFVILARMILNSPMTSIFTGIPLVSLSVSCFLLLFFFPFV